MVATVSTEGVFKVTVDYRMSLKQMISAGRYGWTNEDITAEHFPITEKGRVEAELTYVHLNRIATTAEVLAEIEKRGFRPANIAELLAFGAANPEEQRKHWIVALGSGWLYEDVHEYPILGGGRDYGRCLRIRWPDLPSSTQWGEDDRFLVARK